MLTEAKTIGSPAIPTPIEDNMPREIDSVSGFVEIGIKMQPNIVSKTPKVKIFPVPYLSAIIPEKGATAPITS